MRGLCLLGLIVADLWSLAALLRWGGGGLLFVWLVAAGLLGATLLRRQGLRTLQVLRSTGAGGELPAPALWEALVALLTGLLLLFPGAVSDLLALPLLVPALRRRLARSLHRRAGGKPPRGGGPVVIEGEYREAPPPPPPALPPS